MSFLKIENRVPLPRTTSSQLIESQEVELVPAWSLYSYILVSFVLEDTLKNGQQSSYKTHDLQSVLPARCAREMVPRIVGVANQCLV